MRKLFIYPEDCFTQPCTTSDRLFSYGVPFASFPNTTDVGLVILDAPIYLAEYGQLAAAGSLDSLASRRGQQDLTFTVSGYGLSYINPAFVASFRERLMAQSRLVSLESALTVASTWRPATTPASAGGPASATPAGRCSTAASAPI